MVPLLVRVAAYFADGIQRVGVTGRWGVCDLEVPEDVEPWQVVSGEAGVAQRADPRPWGAVCFRAPSHPAMIISVDDNFRDQPTRRAAGLAATRVAAVEPHLVAGPADEAWFLSRDPASLIGHGGRIVKPLDTSALDCGVSLAVVLARDAFRLSPEEAWSAVAGVTVAIDVVRRDLPPGQGSLARSYASHTPLGPAVVSLDEVPELSGAALSLAIDGEVVQRSSVSSMRASPAQLLAAITRRVPLTAGDVVLTGTPGGTLADRGQGWLQPGVTVNAEIDGVGMLELVVEAELP